MLSYLSIKSWILPLPFRGLLATWAVLTGDSTLRLTECLRMVDVEGGRARAWAALDIAARRGLLGESILWATCTSRAASSTARVEPRREWPGGPASASGHRCWVLGLPARAVCLGARLGHSAFRGVVATALDVCSRVDCLVTGGDGCSLRIESIMPLESSETVGGSSNSSES